MGAARNRDALSAARAELQQILHGLLAAQAQLPALIGRVEQAQAGLGTLLPPETETDGEQLPMGGSPAAE